MFLPVGWAEGHLCLDDENDGKDSHIDQPGRGAGGGWGWGVGVGGGGWGVGGWGAGGVGDAGVGGGGGVGGWVVGGVFGPSRSGMIPHETQEPSSLNAMLIRAKTKRIRLGILPSLDTLPEKGARYKFT